MLNDWKGVTFNAIELYFFKTHPMAYTFIFASMLQSKDVPLAATKPNFLYLSPAFIGDCARLMLFIEFRFELKARDDREGELLLLIILLLLLIDEKVPR